jgi:hypothetical protein
MVLLAKLVVSGRFKSPSIPLFQNGKTNAKITSFDFILKLLKRKSDAQLTSSDLFPTLKKGG